MRAAATCLLLCTALGAQQQGSIEGVTVDSITKAPLAGVHVRLVALTFNGVTAAYGALSDRAGHFSIATIRPGNYIPVPERTGYLYVQIKSAQTGIDNIAIRPGQQLTGVRLEMVPRAILSGRVLDEFGDPVQGVQVTTMPADEKDAPQTIVGPVVPASDDRGEFRISAVPGRYYLQARVYTNSGDRPEVRSDGTSGAPYGSTFYPSSVVKERATVVEAIGGKESPGLDIRLSRQKGLAISGIVSGIPEGTARPQVLAQYGPSAQQINATRGTMVDADGKFTFAALTPGFYRLTANYSAGKAPLTSRPVEVRLDAAEIANVELALLPGSDISGTVLLEGDPPSLPPGKLTVRLQPITSTGFSAMGGSGGSADESGAFRIAGVSAGKFSVRVDPLPENAYVKKVELDGTASPDDTVDLTRGGTSSRVKVTVSLKGAQLSGRVLDENGERLLTPLAMVVLAPSPVPKDFSSPFNDRVQPDGKYSIKSLRPGKYRVIAFDALRIFGPGNAQDALLKMLEKAEEIEIQEGARVEKDIRVQPKEAANAKPKQ